jgi:hypothetical protein
MEMEQKVLAEKIRKKLLIESIITDETIDKASRLIGLTKNGKIIFKIDRRKISISDQILLYLAGKKLAYEAELVESDTCSITELRDELGINEKVIGARLSELIKKSQVDRLEAGLYKINPIVIIDVLNRIEGVLSEESKNDRA